MKKMFLFLGVLMVMFSLAVNVYAGEKEQGYNYELDLEKINYAKTPLNKLARGMINTATCWAEIPAEVSKVAKEKDAVLGSTLGVVQGAFSMFLRGVTGIVEVLTCVVPPYNKALLKPDYALMRADEKIQKYFW